MNDEAGPSSGSNPIPGSGDVQSEKESEVSGRSNHYTDHDTDSDKESGHGGPRTQQKKVYRKRRSRLTSKKHLPSGKVQTLKKLQSAKAEPLENPKMSISVDSIKVVDSVAKAEPLENPRMSISVDSIKVVNSGPRELLELFQDCSDSEGSVHNVSCMSANASDPSSDSDGIDTPIVSDFGEFFSDNVYSSSDSCEALDNDDDDSPDVPQVTLNKGKEEGLLFSTFNSESAATIYLSEKVSEMLTLTSWIIDCTEKSCRLFLLSDQANVVVERSIYWNTTNRHLEMYINNKPIPHNSFLWTDRFPSDYNNCASVANYITMLAFLLGSVNICTGVQKYEEMWQSAVENEEGSIESDIYQGTKCYRPSTCSLGIMSSGTCSVCSKAQEKFKKRDWKRSNKAGSDILKKTNKTMSKEELRKKTEQKAKIIREERRKLGRLRIRIQQLIQRDVITIDQNLGADFTKILRENAHKMTPIQKLFWQEQLKYLSRQANPRAMRWNPMCIKIALKLQEISPAALDYLRESGFLSLPCKRTLYDFTHFADSTEGIQGAILDILQEKLKKIGEETDNEQESTTHKIFANLLFDEMNIKEDLVINKHGEIVGYLHLNKVEESLQNLQDGLIEKKGKKTAKKILVYMLQGINVDLHEVVGIFTTSDLTGAQLHSRTWDVIYNLECRNIPVITLICDAASVNKKFFSMHVKWDPNENFIYATRNVACGDFNRPIFFIIDPPHLLKSLRNCLSNSWAHTKSRKLWKNNQELKWTAIEKLQEEDAGNKFKTHKLTKAHVKLTSFSRMRVSLACQALSMSVAEALNKLREDERFKDIISPELISYVKLCNTFFDCLNGSEDSNGLRNKLINELSPYTSIEDSRFEFLEKTVLGYFDDWLKDVQARRGKFSATDRKKMFISMESYESLHITVHGFCGAVKYCLQKLNVSSVDARNFNQDKLEQEFGSLRMSEGAQNNPTLHRVIQRVMSRHVSKSAALPPKKGNTEARKRTLTVDEEPLMRKRRKEENQ